MSNPFDMGFGRIVHYVDHEWLGSPKVCRAAIVTEECSDAGMSRLIGLAILGTEGLFFHSMNSGGVQYDDGRGAPGSSVCPQNHSNMPFRYCPEKGCGWTSNPTLVSGTWHWPIECPMRHEEV